jgi:hypothetical protein
MINKEGVLIGSDFEFFLKKDGEFISAIPHNVGTKLLPEALDKEGCCVQRDGVLQECNVPPVRLDQAGEFWENVQYVRDFLKARFQYDGITVECCASAVMPKKEMRSKEAKQLGCDADFNAWKNGMVNEKPHVENENFRTCGCHYHMSYEPHTVDTAIELVKRFDLFVTVPFILIDKDKERRKLYGKAGSYRLQQWGNVYGVEFRQLSNKCLEDKWLVEYVFHQIGRMIDHFNETGPGAIDKEKKKIVECINTSNEKIAAKLCDKYNILLPIEYVTHGDLLETV